MTVTLSPMTPNTLFRSTPEAQGVSSTAISIFIDAAAAQGLELHSLMLVRHGAVVVEGWWHPYRADAVHLLYSLSKSFAATAIGFAVTEGRLSVDDPVGKFFSEVTYKHLQKMTVRHLLNMASGHLEDTFERIAEQGDDWVRNFLALPPEREPGTVFAYNQGATLTLAAILQRVTGEGLLDYLRPRLLDPLGVTEARWLRTLTGLEQGFSGLHLTTEAVARFGQLYLQRGQWGGQQLIPAAWVDEATRWLTLPSAEARPLDWSQGYGFQFWRCRHGAYRGDGAFGQFCVVMPEQNAVLALTGAVGDMQAVLAAVWAHLLPAMGDVLSEDEAAHGALTEKLGHLHLPALQGERTSATEPRVLAKTYRFRSAGAGAPAPFELSLSRTGESWVFGIKDAFGEHAIRCGYGTWEASETVFSGSLLPTSGVGHPDPAPVWASGAWTAADTFTLKVQCLETPHALTLSCRFNGPTLTLSRHWNVQFGPVVLPLLEGALQD